MAHSEFLAYLVIHEAFDPIHDTETDDCWCRPEVLPVKCDDGSVTWIYVHNHPGEN